jgi:hypothetical protein
VERVTDDLFDDEPYGLDPRIKRYRFPPPPGVEPSGKGWQRTTNLVKAFSDQYALQAWLERMTMLGLLANDGLIFDELSAVNLDAVDVNSTMKAFAEIARSAVGADKGARKGTARHNVLEHYMFAGEVIGHRRMQVQMHELLAELDRLDFELLPGTQEDFVWHPAGKGVVGRRDVRFLCRRTGQIGTADLKTQEKFWTYQEHAGQQYIYDTAPWVWSGPLSDAGGWIRHMPGNYVGREGGVCPGRRAALLLHMPSKGGPVQVHELDLEYGAQVVAEAERITALRATGKKVGGICPA